MGRLFFSNIYLQSIDILPKEFVLSLLTIEMIESEFSKIEDKK